MIRPDKQFILAMNGQSTTARAFWLVTVLYGYGAVFIILAFTNTFKISVSQQFLNDVHLVYVCFGIFASLRCTTNIKSIWIRWPVRFVLLMMAIWLALAVHYVVKRLLG